MMLRDIDHYFLSKDEPAKSCLQFLRSHLLNHGDQLTEAWKYGMPFYCYRGKMCCYLWTDKKSGQPYLGIVNGNKINHPDLLAGTRNRMKVLMIDPELDIPVDKINGILNMAIAAM